MTTNWLVGLYLLILLCFCFTIIPNNDSYYYWTWSNNLSLSYFDGPPLIAYVIKLSTLIFGNSVFAINFVGLMVSLLTAIVLSNLANEVLNNKLDWCVGLLWITSPSVVTRYILLDVTYDCLLNLFSLFALLYAVKYMKHTKVKYIYYIGIFGGLALLSKYSAIIILLFILVFFICNKKLRQVFKHFHVYLSIFISCIIFSPVLIWNYHHDWASFVFQITFHSWDTQNALFNTKSYGFFNHLTYYLTACIIKPSLIYIGVLVVLFLIRGKNNIKLNIDTQLSRLLFVLLMVFFLFWLVVNIFARVNIIYLLTFHSIIIFYIGCILINNNYKKLTYGLILIQMVASVGKMYDYSLRPSASEAYIKYVVGGKLKFISPLKQSIKY